LSYGRFSEAAARRLLGIFAWAQDCNLSDTEVRGLLRALAQKEEEHTKAALERLKKELHGLPDAKDYKDALTVQDACNISGVLFAFAEVMHRVNNEMNEKGHGHEWRDAHPIVRLFSEQIAHLGRKGDYFVAYKECQERSKETAG
jgi:hypothetical protein